MSTQIDNLRIFVDAVQARRSLRRYTAEAVPRPVVEQILTAGAWAPSAHNRQPWRFVVIVAGGSKERLARAMGARLRADLEASRVPEPVIAKEVGRSYERITLAPVIIVLALTMADMDRYPDEKRRRNEYVMAVQSVAMAGQNILLAAHAAGLGACWMCAPLFVPDVVRDALQLPDDWEAQGMITMGYAAQARERTRGPLEERVLWR